MTIEIKKVKLRDDMFPYVEWDDVHDDGIKDSTKRECNHPVHDDFKDKMKALAVHCLLIDELVDVTKVKGDLVNFQPALLERIKVKGLSISSEDGEGVTVSFERKLSTGRVVNMNTPYTKFNDTQVKYRFDNELQVAVGELKEEVLDYLENAKYGAGAQLSMALGSEIDDSNPHL